MDGRTQIPETYRLEATEIVPAYLPKKITPSAVRTIKPHKGRGMSIDRLLRILVTLKLFEITLTMEAAQTAARSRVPRRRVASRRSAQERKRSCANGEIPRMQCL